MTPLHAFHLSPWLLALLRRLGAALTGPMPTEYSVTAGATIEPGRRKARTRGSRPATPLLPLPEGLFVLGRRRSTGPPLNATYFSQRPAAPGAAAVASTVTTQPPVDACQRLAQQEFHRRIRGAVVAHRSERAEQGAECHA